MSNFKIINQASQIFDKMTTLLNKYGVIVI